MLYYSYPQVVVREVPGELSLALSISGCPLRCQGCHSAETRNPSFGKPLTTDELKELLHHNQHISCVLFYGGEWDSIYLEELFKVVQLFNKKIALYTGLEEDQVPKNLIPYLHLLKVGPYIEDLGGLDSPHTNQYFVDLKKYHEST